MVEALAGAIIGGVAAMLGSVLTQRAAHRQEYRSQLHLEVLLPYEQLVYQFTIGDRAASVADLRAIEDGAERVFRVSLLCGGRLAQLGARLRDAAADLSLGESGERWTALESSASDLALSLEKKLTPFRLRAAQKVAHCLRWIRTNLKRFRIQRRDAGSAES